MAVKVSNLKIQLQNDTDNTYFATWDFKSTNKGSTSTSIKTIQTDLSSKEPYLKS